MRIRTIKPEFWANERIALLPEKTRLLAIALLNYADDEGYFYANPEVMRGQLFPFDRSSAGIKSGLDDLAKLDYLRLAEVEDGRVYGVIVNFEAHQRINRPTTSKIKDLASFSESSVSTHMGNGREQGTGKGKEQGSAIAPVALLPFESPDFLAAWTDFLQHRIEIKKKLTPMASKHLLKKLTAWGEQRAIAAIRHSIANNWTGVFEQNQHSARGFDRPELNGAQMR